VSGTGRHRARRPPRRCLAPASPGGAVEGLPVRPLDKTDV